MSKRMKQINEASKKILAACHDQRIRFSSEVRHVLLVDFVSCTFQPLDLTPKCAYQMLFSEQRKPMNSA